MIAGAGARERQPRRRKPTGFGVSLATCGGSRASGRSRCSTSRRSCSSWPSGSCSTSFPNDATGSATSGWARSSPACCGAARSRGSPGMMARNAQIQDRSTARSRVVVVFLLWVYVSSVILMYGVEFTAAHYRARRRHRRSTPPTATDDMMSRANRLASEQSPYLLQHKDNPVDWYPVGRRGLRARAGRGQADLPVGRLLDVPLVPRDGARELRERRGRRRCSTAHFVSIKVDREERPDVDRVYMTFVQATTGSGGWPMSVWLTPALEPFYGGTYFPPTSAVGHGPGFVEILEEIARAWREERGKVDAVGVDDRRAAADASAQPAGGEPACPATDALDARGRRSSRPPSTARRGGFGDAPKFPRPSELLFLLREHARTGDGRAARHGAAHAAGDGARRHARPPRRRLPSLLGGRRLARAALREDALRPGAARAGLPRGGAGRPATASTPTSPPTRSTTSGAT